MHIRNRNHRLARAAAGLAALIAISGPWSAAAQGGGAPRKPQRSFNLHVPSFFSFGRAPAAYW